ncbi:MAG: acyl-CoA/acyl-ACP dehydrogenase [Candidatus Melainabacteria bacterium]|nr:MAG: acyl-CoA/acyl-ACP dehydrogenase [Candidatus Melainabacteria bacterium]
MKKNRTPETLTGLPSEGGVIDDVLKAGGKSKDEIEKTGELDRSDEIAEQNYDPKFRIENSPVHLAVWSGATPVDRFRNIAPASSSAAYLKQMDAAVAIVAAHREAGTLMGPDNKVSLTVIDDLKSTGYWGALVGTEYGGWGAKLIDAMPLITRMAASGDATVAGMLSIHGCIGAVDPIMHFGSDSLKKKYLPKLASGEILSGFALTEPNAGSDMTALRTTAVRDGDSFVVNGHKTFISNSYYGRTIGLVCMVKGKDLPTAEALRKKAKDKPELAERVARELERARPMVIVCDLPANDTDSFKLIKYGIHAVKHIFNHGLKFTNFRIPAENLLVPDHGDGLTIAYHGLNRGRIALGANAAGTMRLLLKSMLPWAQYRETYGQQIGQRQLVLDRIGELAGFIVGGDAITNWTSSLLDEGYRGELECIIAKIYGARMLLEATTHHAFKTHGGRSFLAGHLIGDNIHDFMAPSIYEGQDDMLDMAFLKGLIKGHGNKYMAPLAKIKGFKPYNPVHLWKGKWSLLGISFFTLWAENKRFADVDRVAGVNPDLQRHVIFAKKTLRKQMLKIHYAMLKHQIKLGDYQPRMIELSKDVRKAVEMLVTCLHASEAGKDEVTVLAADVLCRRLTNEITGKRRSDDDIKANVKLGKLVTAGKFTQIDATYDSAILKPYK